MTDQPRHGSYIRLAKEEQQRYAENLLAENEKLVAELDALRTRIEVFAAENRIFAERYLKIEMHNSNLANLYVSSYQLHASVERETVLQVIQEIVINLVGSEQIAIFETTPAGDFAVSASFGVDAALLKPFRPGEGPIGKHIVPGASVYANPGAGAPSETLTACIPLVVDGGFVGAIAIFRLLEHKTSLQPVDHEIFDLLAMHAASALYCASLRSKVMAVR